MGQQWYYRQNGQQHGPVSGPELKQLAATGKLNAADKVKKDGMADWLPASQVKGLFPDIHDKVQARADAVGKTAGTVSKVAKAAGKVSDAVSDVAEAGGKVQKAATTVAGIAAGGSTLAGSVGDFLRPLGPINLVIFAAALLSGGVLYVVAVRKPKVKVKVRLKMGAVASLAAAVVFGLWSGLGAVAGKDDKGFLATNIKPVEQLQTSLVTEKGPRPQASKAEPSVNPVASEKSGPAPVERPGNTDPTPATPGPAVALAESLESFQKHWQEPRGGRAFFDPETKTIQVTSGGQFGGFTYAAPWQEFRMEFMVEQLDKNDLHLFLTVNGVRLDIPSKNWQPAKDWKELVVKFDRAGSTVTLTVADETVDRATAKGAKWGDAFSSSMMTGRVDTHDRVSFRNPRLLPLNAAKE